MTLLEVSAGTWTMIRSLLNPNPGILYDFFFDAAATLLSPCEPADTAILFCVRLKLLQLSAR